MKTIIIKTQGELDLLETKFDDFTYIEIRSNEAITVRKLYENGLVYACNSSQVTAYDSSQVYAYGNSMISVLSNLVTIKK